MIWALNYCKFLIRYFENFTYLTKLFLARGPIIASIGLIVVVIGANLFDLSYQSVESILRTKSTLMENKEILPNQFTNFTIHYEQLKEHNIIIIHTVPSSGFIKLEGMEPNGMIFEKESKDGFLYHIIQRSNQGGLYTIKISDTGSQPVKINVIMGEDPFLSKNCDTSYGIQCNVVQMSMGMVVIGIIAFIVGILIGMSDFKKEKASEKIILLCALTYFLEYFPISTASAMICPDIALCSSFTPDPCFRSSFVSNA